MGMSTYSMTENDTAMLEIIKNVIAEEIKHKPEILDDIDTVRITPMSFGPTLQKAVLVFVNPKILKFLRIHYKQYLSDAQNLLGDFMILTLRSTEAPKKKGHLSVNRQREEILTDICFPGKIVARTQEVEDAKNSVQHVYLDGEQVYWSDSELQVIENIANRILEEKFSVQHFAY